MCKYGLFGFIQNKFRQMTSTNEQFRKYQTPTKENLRMNLEELCRFRRLCAAVIRLKPFVVHSTAGCAASSQTLWHSPKLTEFPRTYPAISSNREQLAVDFLWENRPNQTLSAPSASS